MFHIELRQGRLRNARVFNLGEDELRRSLIGPWQVGATIKVEGNIWRLDESDVTILEGPELGPGKLALGKGWSNATRESRDVTSELLVRAPATPPVAPPPVSRSVVVMHRGSEDARRDVFGWLGQLGAAPLDWDLLLAGARDGSGDAVTALEQALAIAGAVVVVEGDRDAELLVWAGMAIGAAPRRVVVISDGEPLPALARWSILAGPDALDQLGARLRAAGVPLSSA